MKQYDIIIIGAGLSGIAAAIEIAKTSKSYLILEQSNEIGGKVTSKNIDGFILDKGFQVFLPSYPMFKQYGIKIPNKTFNRGAIIAKPNSLDYVGAPFLKIPEIVKRSQGENILTLKDILHLIQLTFSQSSKKTIDVINESGLSEAIKTSFLLPFLRGILLDYSLEAPWSCCSFYFRNFLLGGAALPDHGIKSLPERMCQGIHIEKNKSVAHIEKNVITCTDGSDYQAKKIIATSPDLLKTKSGTYYYSTSCFYFSSQAKLSLEKNLVLFPSARQGALNHMALLSEVNPSYSSNGSALLAASTVGLANCTEDELKSQLAKIFRVQSDDFHLLERIDIKKALPQITSNEFSIYNSLNIEEDNITFCGEFSSYGSQNGALLSGYQAARKVLAQL